MSKRQFTEKLPAMMRVLDSSRRKQEKKFSKTQEPYAFHFTKEKRKYVQLSTSQMNTPKKKERKKTLPMRCAPTGAKLLSGERPGQEFRTMTQGLYEFGLENRKEHKLMEDQETAMKIWGLCSCDTMLPEK